MVDGFQNQTSHWSEKLAKWMTSESAFNCDRLRITDGGLKVSRAYRQDKMVACIIGLTKTVKIMHSLCEFLVLTIESGKDYLT